MENAASSLHGLSQQECYTSLYSISYIWLWVLGTLMAGGKKEEKKWTGKMEMRKPSVPGVKQAAGFLMLKL